MIWWERDRSEGNGGRYNVSGGWDGISGEDLKFIGLFMFRKKMRCVIVFVGKVVEMSDDILAWTGYLEILIGNWLCITGWRRRA